METKRAFLTCVVLLVGSLSFAPHETFAADTIRPHKGSEPEKVEFGVYVMDIDEISGQDQNFTANFMIFLRWTDERLKHTGSHFRTVPLGEVWHPQVVLTNRQASLRMPLQEVVKIEPDGTVSFRQQYVGPLSQRLRLRDFPLDTQSFSIHFAITGIGGGEIELVPGRFSKDFVGGGMARVLSLPDWRILSYRAEVRPYELTADVVAPGFAFEFVARRHSRYYIWQAIMPLALIVMMSWVPFWVDPKKGELQFSIASGAVLTLIAFRFTLASMLPALPYLTRMDLFTIGVTILVFAAFLQVVITSLLAYSHRLRIARVADHVCRVLFAVAFTALIAWSMFL